MSFNIDSRQSPSKKVLVRLGFLGVVSTYVLFRLAWVKIEGFHWFRFDLDRFVPFTRAIDFFNRTPSLRILVGSLSCCFNKGWV